MRFNAYALVIAPLLGASLALDALPLLKGASNKSFQLSTDGDVGAEASCPPDFPLYCSAYNFCCRSRDVGCCPKACCLPGATYCGSDGYCYGPA